MLAKIKTALKRLYERYKLCPTHLGTVRKPGGLCYLQLFTIDFLKYHRKYDAPHRAISRFPN